MIKVQDFPNLVRDPNSKAIINTDQSAYKEFRQKNIMKDRLTSMDNEINTIKESVDEIKNLLKQLVQK